MNKHPHQLENVRVDYEVYRVAMDGWREAETKADDLYAEVVRLRIENEKLIETVAKLRRKLDDARDR